MKKSEFPEKIYETLINHFLLSKGFDIYVPSQNKEAKLGYDALFQYGKIKVAFLQYKTVNEYDRKPKCHGRSTRAFKFDLYYSKGNGYRQHNLLVKKNARGINCGYFVPCFIEYDTLYNTYHTSSLVNSCNSIMIRPTKIISDNNYHYISFDNKRYVVQHSKEESKVQSFSVNDFLNSIKENDISFGKEELTNEILKDSGLEISEFDDRRVDKAIKILYDCGINLIVFKNK